MPEGTGLVMCRCGRCPLELPAGWVRIDELLAWLRGRCPPRLVGGGRRVAAVIGGTDA